MIDSVANEQSLRYLAAELQRSHLQAAQIAGNLAMTQGKLGEAQKKINELEAKLEVIEHEKDLAKPDEKDTTALPKETPEPSDTSTVRSHGAVDEDEAP